MQSITDTESCLEKLTLSCTNQVPNAREKFSPDVFSFHERLGMKRFEVDSLFLLQFYSSVEQE